MAGAQESGKPASARGRRGRGAAKKPSRVRRGARGECERAVAKTMRVACYNPYARSRGKAARAGIYAISAEHARCSELLCAAGVMSECMARCSSAAEPMRSGSEQAQCARRRQARRRVQNRSAVRC